MKLSFQDKTFLKIFALLISITLWIYVVSEVDVAYTHTVRNVPVMLRNLDRGLEVMNDDNITVDVRLRGKRSVVTAITSNDIRAEVDLANRNEGYNAVPVIVTPPDNVELLDVRPAVAEILLDELITQYMTVDVEFMGKPDNGFFYGTYSVVPQDIYVRGPRSIINQIETIVAVVPVEGVSKSFSKSFPLQVLDKNRNEVRRVSIRPDMVEVFIPIGPINTARVIPKLDISVDQGYLITDIKVIPEQVDFIWLASGTPPKEFETNEVLLEKIRDSVVVTDLSLILPHGVDLLNSAHNKIRLEIITDRIATNTLEKTVSVYNLKEGYRVTLEQEKVKIKLTGPSSELERLKNEEEWLYIDLEDFTEGSYRARINVNVPETVKVDSISISSVLVNVFKE